MIILHALSSRLAYYTLDVARNTPLTIAGYLYFFLFIDNNAHLLHWLAICFLPF